MTPGCSEEKHLAVRESTLCVIPDQVDTSAPPTYRSCHPANVVTTHSNVVISNVSRHILENLQL